MSDNNNTQVAERDQGAVTRQEATEARRRQTLTPAVDIVEKTATGSPCGRTCQRSEQS